MFLHIAISICHKQKIYYKQCTWSGQTEFIYRLRGLRINCAKLQPPVISGDLLSRRPRSRRQRNSRSIITSLIKVYASSNNWLTKVSCEEFGCCFMYQKRVKVLSFSCNYLCRITINTYWQLRDRIDTCYRGDLNHAQPIW